MKNIFNLLCLIVLVFLGACEGDYMQSDKTINNVEINLNDIDALARKKIYFGHQSVGFNILDGVNDLLANQNEISKLRIVKSNNAEVFDEPVFAHSTIGENSNPLSKLSDFKHAIENGIGDSADFAFFKFCYLDVDKNTNIDELFSKYKSTLEELEKKYPGTKFIHFTVPLTVSKFTFRNFLKSILGVPDNNINRNKYNKKIIETYGKNGLVYNLAEIESTYPDRSRSYFESGGVKYYSLAPEYAADSGHLNELGKKVVAKDFLIFLSEAAENEN